MVCMKGDNKLMLNWGINTSSLKYTSRAVLQRATAMGKWLLSIVILRMPLDRGGRIPGASSNAWAYNWRRGNSHQVYAAALFLSEVLGKEVYLQLLGYSSEWRLTCLVYLSGKAYPILLPYDILKAPSCKFTDVFQVLIFLPWRNAVAAWSVPALCPLGLGG